MDFSRLPDTAFLKIFQYLPWENRIRVGRVNKSFRRISQFAISRTKCLNLYEGRLKNLRADQFVVLLDLCAPNLEKIKFLYTGDFRPPLATTFANYQFPRLVDIDLEDASIDNIIFGQLIRNCPKIERLAWKAYNVELVVFPDVVNNHLKTLDLIGAKDPTIESLIGRCPNLNELHLEMEDVTADVLDRFFCSVPQLQKVVLQILPVDRIPFQVLVNIWNLPLTLLHISVYTNADIVLHKIATSFPHMQKLDIYVKNASNAAIASLGDLQELEMLYLDSDTRLVQNEGIRQLSRCQSLRKLDLYSSVISENTLATLFQRSPLLESITTPYISGVDSPEEAADALEGLSGSWPRNIAIGFYTQKKNAYAIEDWLKSLWETQPVRDVIQMLEENEGLKVEVHFLDIQYMERHCPLIAEKLTFLDFLLDVLISDVRFLEK